MKTALAVIVALWPLYLYAETGRITCVPDQQHFCSFNNKLGEMNCAPVAAQEYNYISRIDIDSQHQIVVLSRWTDNRYDTSPRKINKFYAPNGINSRAMIVFEHSNYFLSYLYIDKGRFSLYHQLAPFSLHQQIALGNCE
jgi:hypothetical protein